jgi:uncharacterized protein (DUF1330 family)
MSHTGSLEPTPAQLEQLVGAAVSDREPIVMINLLRFKEHADGVDAADDISGEEAYRRYAALVGEHLQRVGARLVSAFATAETVIGPEESEWDVVLAVEYPSRSAFLEMTGDPRYLEIHKHRTAALADSRLIACRPLRT